MLRKSRKSLFQIGMLFICIGSLGQTESNEIKSNNSLNLKVNLSSFVDQLSFPTLEIAVEKRFKNYLGIQAEVGIQVIKNPEKTFSDEFINLNAINFPPIMNTTGYRFRAEGRYYINDYIRYKKNNLGKRKSGFYTGINFLYRKNTYDASYEVKNNDFDPIISTNYIDRIGVRKSAFATNLLIGGQVYVSDKFFFELTYYLGVIDRTIKNFERESPKINTTIRGGILTDEYRNLEEFSGISFNGSFAIRFGYKIW